MSFEVESLASSWNFYLHNITETTLIDASASLSGNEITGLNFDLIVHSLSLGLCMAEVLGSN